MDEIRGLRTRYTDEEVVRFDIAVNELLLVHTLYTCDL